MSELMRYNEFMWFFVKKGISIAGVAGVCLGIAYFVESYYVLGEVKLVGWLLYPVDLVNRILT